VTILVYCALITLLFIDNVFSGLGGKYSNSYHNKLLGSLKRNDKTIKSNKQLSFAFAFAIQNKVKKLLD